MSRKRVASNEPLANLAKKHKSDSYIIQNNLRDELIITIYSLKRQLFSNDDNNLNLKETLLRLNDKTAKISIECQENYNLASLLSSNANPLKGKDCRIYHALKRANEELDLDNKFYFLFAFYSEHENKVKHWFYPSGGPAFENSAIDFDEFTLIKKNQNYTKTKGIFYLTMWPIKHELPIKIKLDLLNYINSLMKEMTIDDIFYNTNEKIELIIHELIECCPKYINAIHLNSIFDCLDYGQHEELAKRFICSTSFAYYFKLYNKEINQKLFYFIEKYDLDILLNILSPQEFHNSRVNFVKLFSDNGNYDTAYQILNTFLLPFDRYFSIELIQILTRFKENEFQWKNITQSILDYCSADTHNKLENILDLIRTLYRNDSKDLLRECLNLTVINKLDNIKSFHELMDCSSFEFALNLIKFLACEAIEYESSFKTFCDLLIQSDRVNRIEFIVEDIETSYRDYKDNEQIRYLLDNVVKFYQLKITTAPPFTWRMPNAVVPKHPDIERFLQGENDVCVFKGFTAKTARVFAERLESKKTVYRVRCEIMGNGSNTKLKVIKLKDFALIKKNFKEYFEERLIKIKKVLNE